MIPDFEKILAFVTQVTHSITSWQAVITNIIPLFVVLIFHHAVKHFYVTLEGMNNTFVTVAIWLSMFSLYGLLYKAVSACFSAVSKHKADKEAQKNESIRKERMIQDILNLSKSEIAILKFILAQEHNIAWMPDEHKTIIMLREKGIITLFCKDSKTISTGQSLNFASLLTIPDNVQKLLSHMPQDFHKKWRKIKQDNSFQDCQ